MLPDPHDLPVLHLAAYRFTALDGLPALRERLLDDARALALKGTVLLADEGINLMLAGDAASVRSFVHERLADAAPQLAGLDVKESWSAALPFGRLRVKIKPEIIRMNRPQVQPAAARAPAVDATTLARWLDQGHDDDGRPLLMLDTRNGFEVDAGRFANAVDWRLGKFSDFPAALAAHAPALAGHTVVSYCTGGIRCEKAALLLRAEGVDHVLQLDGGILRYFDLVGSRHFDGHCVVFDDRGALDAGLRPAR